MQNNQKPTSNLLNPFYAEVSLTKYEWKPFLQATYTRDILQTLPTICLHDYIPGMVQKVALD